MAPAEEAGVVSRTIWTLAVVAFLALAVAAPVQMVKAADKSSGGTAKAAGTTGGVEVAMVNLSFQPGELSVLMGTEVVFRNKDVAPHTVTAVGGGRVDSGILGPGKVYKLVLNETLEYFCQIHPQMKGKVVLTG